MISIDEETGLIINEYKEYVKVRSYKAVKTISDNDVWWRFNAETGLDEVIHSRFQVNESGTKKLGAKVNGTILVNLILNILNRERIDFNGIIKSEIIIDNMILFALAKYGIRTPEDLLLIKDLVIKGEDLNQILKSVFLMTLNGYKLSNIMEIIIELRHLKWSSKQLFEKNGLVRSASLRKNINIAYQNCVQQKAILKSLGFIQKQIDGLQDVKTLNIIYEETVPPLNSISHRYGLVKLDAVMELTVKSFIYEAKLTTDTAIFSSLFWNGTYAHPLKKALHYYTAQSIIKNGAILGTNYENFQRLALSLSKMTLSEITDQMKKSWNLLFTRFIGQFGMNEKQCLHFIGDFDLGDGNFLHNFHLFVVSGEDLSIPNLAISVASTLQILLNNRQELTVENILRSII